MNDLAHLIKQLKGKARIQFAFPVIMLYGGDWEEIIAICKENPVKGYKAFIVPNLRPENGGGKIDHILLKETKSNSLGLFGTEIAQIW